MATLSAKELASELGTDGRTVRKFLRELVRAADLPNPGKGSRWSIEKKDTRKLRTAFNRWIEAKATESDTEAESTEEVEETEVPEDA